MTSTDNQPARIHSCGNPMTTSAFGPRDSTPQYRSQPIWTCMPCNAWEPHEDWQGALPQAWNGQAWNDGGAR